MVSPGWLKTDSINRLSISWRSLLRMASTRRRLAFHHFMSALVRIIPVRFSPVDRFGIYIEVLLELREHRTNLYG